MQARPSASPTTTHTVLREHTRTAHQRLHELPVFRALLAGTLPRRAYAGLLARLHGYYERVDAVLGHACARFGAHEAAYRYAARAPLFARDLESLGLPDTHRQAQPCVSTLLPEVDSAARLAGALYVIEGSLLGGATLHRAARRLLAREDLADGSGRLYWAWCEDVGAARWLNTLALIDGWVDTPARLTDASTAARITFERLHGWLHPLAEGPC